MPFYKLTISNTANGEGFWGCTTNLTKGKAKGTAIPLQVWTSPEGSRRLRFPYFKIIGT